MTSAAVLALCLIWESGTSSWSSAPAKSSKGAVVGFFAPLAAQVSIERTCKLLWCVLETFPRFVYFIEGGLGRPSLTDKFAGVPRRRDK